MQSLSIGYMHGPTYPTYFLRDALRNLLYLLRNSLRSFLKRILEITMQSLDLCNWRGTLTYEIHFKMNPCLTEQPQHQLYQYLLSALVKDITFWNFMIRGFWFKLTAGLQAPREPPTLLIKCWWRCDEVFLKPLATF